MPYGILLVLVCVVYLSHLLCELFVIKQMYRQRCVQRALLTRHPPWRVGTHATQPKKHIAAHTTMCARCRCAQIPTNDSRFAGFWAVSWLSSSAWNVRAWHASMSRSSHGATETYARAHRLSVRWRSTVCIEIVWHDKRPHKYLRNEIVQYCVVRCAAADGMQWITLRTHCSTQNGIEYTK